MLSDVQQFNLTLVKEIDAICRKHGIEYYLAGGSVIGALRHRGFIPWDDDMDLYMTRSNWEKFKRAFNEEGLSDRTLECSDINPNYPNMIAKYTSTNTTAIYKNLLSGDFNAGIIIDILILDPVPGDEETQREHLKNLLIYSEFVNPYYVYSHRFEVDIDYDSLFSRESQIGHEQIVREFEQKVTAFSEEESDTYVLRWGGVPHVFSKDLFGTPKSLPFEGIDLPLPAKSYKYLAQLYGEDWYQIPDHSDKVVHDAVFSAKTEFETFFNDYRSYIDADEYRDTVLGRKRNRLKVGPSFRAIQDTTQEFEARRIAMSIKDADVQDDLRSLFEAGRFDELDELFKDYFKTQCSSRFLGNKYFAGVYRYFHPVYCDIGDDLLWMAVEMMCRKGKIYHPKRIIEAKAYKYGTINGQIEGQYSSLLRLIEAIDCFEQGDCAKAGMIAEYESQQRPNWIAFIKLRIECLLRAPKPDYEAIQKLIEKGRLANCDDADWLAYEAEVLFDADEYKALELCEKSVHSTRNGMVLLRIQDRFKALEDKVISQVHDLLKDGELSEALRMINAYEAYCEALKPYKALVRSREGEIADEELVGVVILDAIRSSYRNDAAESDLAYFHEMLALAGDQGSGKKLHARLREYRAAGTLPSEETVHQVMESGECDELIVLGFYYRFIGAFDKAFEIWYRLIGEDKHDETIGLLLKNEFRSDMAYFYRKFSAATTGSGLAKRSYHEWLYRHGSIARWLHAIETLKLIDLSKLNSVFDYDADYFESMHVTPIVHRNFEYDDDGRAFVEALQESGSNSDSSSDVVAPGDGVEQDIAFDFETENDPESQTEPREPVNNDADKRLRQAFSQSSIEGGDAIAFFTLLDSLIKAQRRL